MVLDGLAWYCALPLFTPLPLPNTISPLPSSWIGLPANFDSVSLSLCSEYTKHPEPLMRVNERGQMGEGDQCDHLSYVWIDSPDSPGYLGRSGLIWVDLPAFADWKMGNGKLK